ncbi:hypothetical protein [Rossellomorea aquimaris]|uniref:Uncharacterized protein n=1 Tax=Rossellomorea aquimaris TaxID=189382 RepID=A0A5D4UB42_9BACI|nr:hypothetical protein [Rossellomorea aquimaris]TYS78880.1 hypothetical protein FZD05_10120 [Rossellomorea aquimaris]TYS84625.1 hypothetical protein FZC85_14750 [Rossellomorea aquimaris]
MSMKAIHDENKYLEFINNIVDAKTKLIQGRTNEDAPYPNIVNVSLRKWREETIELLAQSLRIPDSNTISRWACSSVTLFRQLDLSLEVAIEDLHYFRDEIGNMIKIDSIKIEMSIDTFYELLSLFHSGVDRAIYRLTMAYSHPLTLKQLVPSFRSLL